MGKCWFCSNPVSDNSDETQYVMAGIIKKGYKPICDRCSNNLKHIESVNSADEDVEYAIAYFNKIETLETEPKKYIQDSLEKRNKEKNRVKEYMYYVYDLPAPKTGLHHTLCAKVPAICTNCLCETEKFEKVTTLEIEEDKQSSTYRRTVCSYKKHEFKFGLCKECKKNRKRLSARFATIMTNNTFGFMFTNKTYAEIFAQINGGRISEVEDRGDSKAKSENAWSKIRFWLAKHLHMSFIGAVFLLLLVLYLIT